MTSDPNIREQAYQYFVREAPELLTLIEQELLTLIEDRSINKVHSLMRATHTLKGSAANVGLETINTIAHHLEDVFKALYNPELEIDSELEYLLMQGYECLRLPLMTEISGGYIDDNEIMERAVAIFAKLQEKLGDYLARETPIPTSVELGFDITKSLFEVGVKQRLEELAEILLTNSDNEQIAEALTAQAEVFIGLAESLSLPGFGAIAQTTLAALDTHPQQAHTILEVALEDFWQAWNQVMVGDRTSGGEPSLTLQQLAQTSEQFQIQEELILAEEGWEIEEEQLIYDAIISEQEEQFQIEELPIDEEGWQIEETLPILDYPLEIEPEFIAEESLEIADAVNGTIPDTTLDDVFGNIEETANTNREIEQPEVTISEPEIPKQTQISSTNQSSITHSPLPITNSPPKVKKLSPAVRVDLDLLEQLGHLAEELLIGHNRLENINEQLQNAIACGGRYLKRHQQTMNHLRDLSDRMFSIQSQKGVQLQVTNLRFIENLQLNQFDSLELDRYTELHVLLQSALEEMVQLEEATDSTDFLAKQSGQILEKQRRLLDNVQDDMQQARMSPLGDIFNRFPRLLQQLSNTHKKPVELTLRGTEILVDRALAEKLYDPLLHIIRNAFDHGIEPAQIRASRGKPETGKIEICAYHQGNQTIIEINDDGEGINCDRVGQRAVELNLISAEQASSLSDSAVFDLLFEPGFSTAAKLSDLSGRGVGLDAVRAQIQALSGSVTVRSIPGEGTTFVLQFPLTLTMAKLMICEAGGAVYALLSDAIEQILIPKSDQVHDNNGQKVLHLNQGSVPTMIPVYNMAEILTRKMPMSSLPSEISSFKLTQMLLLRQGSGQELVGLEIDQILGEQELVIRPLGKAIAPPNYIYGGSTLADGRLSLVIDGATLVNSLLDRVTGRSQISELKSPIQNRNYQMQRQSEILLVVDDSISLRQTLALTLEQAGYTVIQAQNGREAVQQLQTNPGVKLVICDVEMPTMNGFEFLSVCRQDGELAKIPVVMLTSRTGEKHRTLARELGAVRFFNKPFKQQEILGAIAQFVK